MITRTYAGDVDLSRIATLLVACNQWEQGEHGTLRLFRRAWRHNVSRLTCLWEDPTGQLVACALLIESLYRLKRAGIYTAILETTHDNTVAQRLYATVGFRTISSTLFYTKSIPLQ